MRGQSSKRILAIEINRHRMLHDVLRLHCTVNAACEQNKMGVHRRMILTRLS